MLLDFEKCWSIINEFFSEEFEAAGEMRKIGATRRLIDKLKNFQQAEESANSADAKPNTTKGCHAIALADARVVIRDLAALDKRKLDEIMERMESIAQLRASA